MDEVYHFLNIVISFFKIGLLGGIELSSISIKAAFVMMTQAKYNACLGT